MITRVWHGRTSKEKARAYQHFLETRGTSDYRKTPGNISIKIWTRDEDTCCHFWTVTEWNDLESIKGFAGEDFWKAKYYPDDQGVLLEFEERVEHYQSYDVSQPAG